MSASSDMVIVRKEGLYCVPGQFYIDPWRPVDRAVITHAHGDHARGGHQHYLTAATGVNVVKSRLGPINIDGLPYGERIVHNGVTISLHPAGHVLGSAQVRMEHKGEVWVASGDYKVEADSTCEAFEPVRCDTFITESTFGMPIYRWQPQQDVYDDINDWWRANAEQGRASVMQCYSFGKAQRILSGLDPSIGPIICHGAVQTLNKVYREDGVWLPPTVMVDEVDKQDIGRSIIIAPPAAAGSSWSKRFGDFSDAFASGWMQLRGARRRRGVDRGFVLSDHADWPGLMQAINATGAERVIVTHGSIPVLVRWLQQQGLQASGFDTEYGDDEADEVAAAGPAADPAATAAAAREMNSGEAADAADAASADASAAANAADAASADASAAANAADRADAKAADRDDTNAADRADPTASDADGATTLTAPAAEVRDA